MDKSRILVVVAHPDDEILGCGATIRKCFEHGDSGDLYALVLAEGITSRKEQANQNESVNTLRSNAVKAADIVGYKDIFFENFPDNRMDWIDLLDIVHKISEYVEDIKPRTIFTHHHGDLNVDHRQVYKAVITSCRPMQSSCVKEIYSFQIPSSTEWNFPYYRNSFSPNVFVNVEDTIEKKISAMACYESERREPPHPRSSESIRNVAAQWGSTVGLRYVEALETVYRIC